MFLNNSPPGSTSSGGRKYHTPIKRHQTVKVARKKLKRELPPGQRHPIDILKPSYIWVDPKHGVRVFIAEVNPEQAEELLKCNVVNRKISPSAETVLIDEITQGNWMLTNQGVGFDRAGCCIDGGHRFSAIRDSGKSATLLFVCDLESKAQEVLDRQRPRAVRDDLQMLGISYGRERVSYIKMCAELYSGSNVSFRTLNTYENWLSPFKKGVDWAVDEMVRQRHTKLAPVGGTIAFAYKKSPEKVAEFGLSLREGIGLEAGSPVLLFSKYLQNHKSSYGGSSRVEICMHLMRCLRDYIEGYKPPARRSPAADGMVIEYFRSAYSARVMKPLTASWENTSRRF